MPFPYRPVPSLLFLRKLALCRCLESKNSLRRPLRRNHNSSRRIPRRHPRENRRINHKQVISAINLSV